MKTCSICNTQTLTDDAFPEVTIEVDDDGNHDDRWSGPMCLSCARKELPKVLTGGKQRA